MASALGSPQHSSFLDFGAVAVLGPPKLHVHPRQTREHVRHFQSVQVYQGGGLHVSGSYQQEALSSVHFEHCLADSALAVEDVDGCF